MRAPRLAAVLPLLALALAGCTTPGCEEQAAPAAAALDLGSEGVEETLVRDVLAERGWTLDGPSGVAATFTLQDDTLVTVDASGRDAQERVTGLDFRTDATATSEVGAAQRLAPAVEPIVAGLSERLGRDLSATYAAPGASACA